MSTDISKIPHKSINEITATPEEASVENGVKLITQGGVFHTLKNMEGWNNTNSPKTNSYEEDDENKIATAKAVHDLNENLNNNKLTIVGKGHFYGNGNGGQTGQGVTFTNSGTSFILKTNLVNGKHIHVTLSNHFTYEQGNVEQINQGYDGAKFRILNPFNSAGFNFDSGMIIYYIIFE